VYGEPGAVQEAAAAKAGSWKALFAARTLALRETEPWLKPSTFEVQASGQGLHLHHTFCEKACWRACHDSQVKLPLCGASAHICMHIACGLVSLKHPASATSAAVDMLTAPLVKEMAAAKDTAAGAEAATPAAGDEASVPAAATEGDEGEGGLCLVFLVDGSGAGPV
jgi:hypothetical protein